MDSARISSMREAVGQLDGRLDGFGERLRAEVAQGHQRRVHHAGHERRRGCPPPGPSPSGRVPRAGPEFRPAAACGGGRNRPWPVSAWCRPRRWRRPCPPSCAPGWELRRPGRSARIPTTEAASMVAMPASTALPPLKYMRMPASVAYSLPPATAPRVPREGRRTVRSEVGAAPASRRQRDARTHPTSITEFHLPMAAYNCHS